MHSSSIQKKYSSALVGAAFLMATSAIGPGFITQTTVFTQQLLTSFGFVILISIVLDITAQLNTWRIIAVANLRAPEIADKVFPGLGKLLAILVIIGGLAFNIGNVAGAGLGLNVLTGMDTLSGAIISAIIAIFIFLFKEAGKAMDIFTKLLGFVMVALTLYVAIASQPPVVQTIQHSIFPQKINTLAIVTLVGGTVGGYISFAGAHRLLDAGIHGASMLPQVSRGSISAILLASVMRLLLFMAALGVVTAGASLSNDNPAASVFQFAAGNIGYRIFGVVLWAAAITSVVGSAYTSVSFLRSYSILVDQYYRSCIIAFILISTFVFAFIGKPVNVLLFVGTLNGLILPLALACMLLAVRRKDIVGNYRHPIWMQVAGWLVVLLMLLMGIKTIVSDLPTLWR